MIVIKTMFEHISFPKNLEFAIYTQGEYALTEDHRISDNLEESCGVFLGDLHIRTTHAEYIFGKVRAVYEVAARMIRYLASIFMNLS